MGKTDSWITKIPRLKNSKVARFSYRAEAYANDEIEAEIQAKREEIRGLENER